LAAVSSGIFVGERTAIAAADGSSRTIVDMAGRTVTVPERVSRVACVEVLCYEKFFLLGAAGKVAEMGETDPPWMSTIDPNVIHLPKVRESINREELLRDGVDIVFMRYDQLRLRGLAAIGMPAVVSQPPLQTQFKSAGAFVEAQKRMVRLIAKVIGGDAVRRSEEWGAYFDERISYLTARIANIPESQRPRAYYLRGPSATTTQGPDSNTTWYGTIGGANMIARNLPLNGPVPISMEEIVNRDPEFIFVGRQYSPGLVLNDPKWSGVSAVKNHHVIPLPEGMFYWDGSTEGMLLAELVAKTLYPDRFIELDMAREVRRYFKTFYDFSFTDEQIDKFLRGLTPTGIRRNY
jgi:iron complex transport system substrate-binding protein